jgi:hypothetical protein
MKFLSVLCLAFATTLSYASDCENFVGRYECENGKTLEISHNAKKKRLGIRSERNDFILDHSYSTKSAKKVKSEKDGGYFDNDGMIGMVTCQKNEIKILTEDFFSEGDPTSTTISKTQDGIQVRALFQNDICKSF